MAMQGAFEQMQQVWQLRIALENPGENQQCLHDKFNASHKRVQSTNNMYKMLTLPDATGVQTVTPDMQTSKPDKL
jgi:hypothetical protein